MHAALTYENDFAASGMVDCALARRAVDAAMAVLSRRAVEGIARWSDVDV